MEINDILKLISLTQTEIDALSDNVGLYFNSTTGKLNLNGLDMNSEGMDATMYDPNSVQDDVFDYANFLGTFQVPGTAQTVNLSSDIDNLTATANIVNLTTSSNDRRITGIEAPPSGVNRIIFFYNQSTQYRIKFVNQSGSSTAENRIVLRSQAGTRNLLQQQMAIVSYNHLMSRWFVSRIG